MTKRLLIAILSIGLTMHVTGCTSGGGQGDGDVAESNDESFSEESNGDFADGSETTSTEGADAQPAEGEAVAQNLDDIGSDGNTNQAADAAKTDVAANEAAAPSNDELVLDTAEPLPEEAATDPAAAPTEQVATTEAPAPTDEPVFNTPPATEAPPPVEPVAEAAPAPETPVESVAAVPVAEPAAKPAFAPLKKIREQAFAAKDGTNLNRVYVARPGDTMKSVSGKIYGKNRSKDLKVWNSKSSLKTGDKVYYASPNHADDTSMKVFYEDIGVQPSTYTSKDGDNIRVVSKQLLGNSQSWKEVWATNPSVESKGDIPAGLEIRYWPEGAEASATLAQQTKPENNEAVAPPSTVAENNPPPMDPVPDLPPPPTDLAANDLPTPPSSPGPAAATPDAGAAGTTGSLNVPPPPPPDIPPPPEAKPVVKSRAVENIEGEPEADQMMWLAAGGLMLMAAAVIYVVMKKNRAKRIDLSQTQV